MTILERKKWIHESFEYLNQNDTKDLYSCIPMEEIQIKKNPVAGLIQMKVIDTFETEFYLGEVLVTEAEVMYRNHQGYAMILGEDLEKALLLASVDALLNSENDSDQMKSSLFQKLEQLISNYKNTRQVEEKIIMQTKVDFKTF